jgi:amino acid transporter
LPWLLPFFPNERKYPEWKTPAEILRVGGVIVTIIGILRQAYLIALRSGQHLIGTHAILGLLAMVLIILGLVFWIRSEKQPEKKDENFGWILVIGVAITLASIVLGF